MSKEMAVAFIEKARNDTAIQQNVMSVVDFNNFDKVIDLASGLGFTFSEADFTSAARDEADAMGLKYEELTESDLESVTGGVVNGNARMTISGGTSVISSGTSVINPSGGIPNTARAGYNVSGQK